MTGEREAKRARQACQNCRRKKIRCSGEKPSCACCSRLKQECLWTDREGPFSSGDADLRPSNGPDSALAARVALLESKLSLLSDDGLSREVVPQGANAATQNLPESNTPEDSVSPYATLPKRQVINSLVETYFRHSHNQPYALFHEATFKQRLEQGSLPEHLLYAVAATACRFTDLHGYQGHQSEAIVAYAQASWKQLVDHSFSEKNSPDLSMVQAISLLTIVDFTAGNPKLGRVKFALAIRFAQSLHLNEEPDAELAFWVQEERRRTFWSVYLLDQLISTGMNRFPSFIDADCTVSLPCDEVAFRDGLGEAHLPALETAIENPAPSSHYRLDHFAMTILMATALGRFIRLSMKRSPRSAHPIWDPRSQWHTVHRMLLHFESYSPCTFTDMTSVLADQFTVNGLLDQQRAGHFIYSHALFHLNHCLLNHPFILHHHFRHCPEPVPPSFVQEALQRCYKHASDLLDLLRDARQAGALMELSYYGYCAMTPGLIHCLYASHEDANTADFSKKKVEEALEFLRINPARWSITGHMLSLLESFAPAKATTNALTNPLILSQKQPLADGEVMWKLLDYASLADKVAIGLILDRVSSKKAGQTTSTRLDPLNPTPSSADVVLLSETASPIDMAPFADSFLRNYLGEEMGGIWEQVWSEPNMGAAHDPLGTMEVRANDSG